MTGAGTASAQEASQDSKASETNAELEEIVVTGTLMRGVAPTGTLEMPGTSRCNVLASFGATIGNFTTSATLFHSAGYDLEPTVGTQSDVDAFDTVDLYFAYNIGAETGLLKDLPAHDLRGQRAALQME